jgi:hypothetical protein
VKVIKGYVKTVKLIEIRYFLSKSIWVIKKKIAQQGKTVVNVRKN